MKLYLAITLAFVCCKASLLAADSVALPVRSPREMLQIMQIDESQLRFFRDGRSIHGDETEPLVQLLFRLPQCAQADVDRWAKPIDEVPAMLANPDSYRFEMYDLRGQIVDLKKLSIIPELVPRLRFRTYYEITLRHDDTDSVVYARTVPKRWYESVESRRPIHETVRAQALLLKRGVLSEKPALVFVTSRINWHPSETSDELGVHSDQVLLGQLGVDIDRLTDVTQKSGIDGADRECFYQALSAVRLAEPQQLAKLGRREFDIARMIQTPDQVAGELYTLHGVARRAILIQVNDPDIRERFNIDHYYEIDVFVPLDKQVRFLDANEPNDREGKVFTQYPFVVCVPKLPEGMAEGDDIRVALTFSGFFIKLWAYRTEFMSGGRPRTAKPKLQQSPLFIGPTVTIERPDKAQESQLSLIISVLSVGCLFGVWFVLWRASIKDKVVAKQLLRKHDPADRSFDVLGDLE